LEDLDSVILRVTISKAVFKEECRRISGEYVERIESMAAVHACILQKEILWNTWILTTGNTPEWCLSGVPQTFRAHYVHFALTAKK